jgi:hypothetical protein
METRRMLGRSEAGALDLLGIKKMPHKRGVNQVDPWPISCSLPIAERIQPDLHVCVHLAELLGTIPYLINLSVLD